MPHTVWDATRARASNQGGGAVSARRKLSTPQWLSLFGLMLGIVVVNLSTAKGTSRAGEGYKQNATLGFVAVRSPRAARRLAATAPSSPVTMTCLVRAALAAGDLWLFQLGAGGRVLREARQERAAVALAAQHIPQCLQPCVRCRPARRSPLARLPQFLQPRMQRTPHTGATILSTLPPRSFGALTACTTARQDLAEKGFFYGFDGVVVCVILINSIGGARATSCMCVCAHGRARGLLVGCA